MPPVRRISVRQERGERGQQRRQLAEAISRSRSPMAQEEEHGRRQRRHAAAGVRRPALLISTEAELLL